MEVSSQTHGAPELGSVTSRLSKTQDSFFPMFYGSARPVTERDLSIGQKIDRLLGTADEGRLLVNPASLYSISDSRFRVKRTHSDYITSCSEE